MARVTRSKPVAMDVCDLCDEELPTDGHEPGEIGTLTRGYGPGPVVLPRTKLARLIWPPAGRDRLMSWKERTAPENQFRVYEFHAQCIRDLVEGAITNRSKEPRP